MRRAVKIDRLQIKSRRAHAVTSIINNVTWLTSQQRHLANAVEPRRRRRQFHRLRLSTAHHVRHHSQGRAVPTADTVWGIYNRHIRCMLIRSGPKLRNQWILTNVQSSLAWSGRGLDETTATPLSSQVVYILTDGRICWPYGFDFWPLTPSAQLAHKQAHHMSRRRAGNKFSQALRYRTIKTMEQTDGRWTDDATQPRMWPSRGRVPEQHNIS